MSVFHLPELARIAGKDARTMRRWCEHGFFGRSAYQTSGGHWRVRGSSAGEVVAKAKGQAAGFARQRLSKEESARRQIERMGKRLARFSRFMQSKARFGRREKVAAKYLNAISGALCDKTKDELELLGLNESVIRDLSEIPIAGKLSGEIMTASLCVWMAESEDWRKTSTARCAGLSRRCLGRVFGRYWDRAKTILELLLVNAPEVVEGWQTKDKRGGQSIAERVPVVMPECDGKSCKEEVVFLLSRYADGVPWSDVAVVLGDLVTIYGEAAVDDAIEAAVEQSAQLRDHVRGGQDNRPCCRFFEIAAAAAR